MRECFIAGIMILVATNMLKENANRKMRAKLPDGTYQIHMEEMLGDLTLTNLLKSC